MAFQSVPNTFVAEVRYVSALKRIENTLYFENPAGYDADFLTDFAESLFVAWGGNVVNELSSELSLVEVYCKGLTSIVDVQALYIPGAPIAGGVVSASLPNSVACCIAFKSGLTGRSSRGRIYIPGIPENAVTGDTFVGTFASGMASSVAVAVNEAILPFPGTNHVIVSRVTGGAPRLIGETYIVNSYQSTDNEVDSRRSRVK